MQLRSRTPNILYLVHDLADPSVHKRVAMLRDGGASVVLAGFCRAEVPGYNVTRCPAVSLGKTYNGKFAQRVWSVLREVAQPEKLRTLCAQADIVIARNLEMLALAVRGNQLDGKKVIYECLDIHRLLLGTGVAARSLRWLEGWLSRKASALITSSPAFTRAYFKPLSKVRLPVMMLENKLYRMNAAAPAPGPAGTRMAGPPWRIGWFGAIRCRKSLQILSELVKQSDGRIEVVIRGRPAYDQFKDFDRSVNEVPGLTFHGPYKNPNDLAAIYGDVHFTWAVDMFEEGQNSSWLLPNRIYEGGAYGAVPIADARVETGRFLDALGIGVIMPGIRLDLLKGFFANLTPQQYRFMAQAVEKVPQEVWSFGAEDCKRLVEELKALPVAA
ncbi:MAG TPA: glycosyltransferase [Rickettsiales bacterium]|nr:glycosyltransferase [Rickettsiales bacterium]